jgi:hypothetical protein
MVAGYPSKAEFAGQLDSAFTARRDDGEPFALRLADLEEAQSTPRVESFALRFHAPESAPAQQGLYHLDNHALGSMDVFLVPVARENGSLVLEAVFTRFIDDKE